MQNLRMMLSDKKTRLKEALMNIQEFDVVAENCRNEILVCASGFDTIGELSVDWADLRKQIHNIKVSLCLISANCVEKQ